MAKKQIKSRVSSGVTLPSSGGKAVKKVAGEKQINSGRVYVTATFNNTLVTVTDLDGKVLFWSSSGATGFKGARKATPFAAISAVEAVVAKAKEISMTNVEVYIKGPGPGRDASVRALRNVGINITALADVTPIPHNGPRAKKRRRV